MVGGWDPSTSQSGPGTFRKVRGALDARHALPLRRQSVLLPRRDNDMRGMCSDLGIGGVHHWDTKQQHEPLACEEGHQFAWLDFSSSLWCRSSDCSRNSATRATVLAFKTHRGPRPAGSCHQTPPGRGR